MPVVNANSELHCLYGVVLVILKQLLKVLLDPCESLDAEVNGC